MKVLNIRRDPRVAVSIPKPDRPYEYVVLEGTATVTQEDVAQTIMDISVRYLGQEQGGAFSQNLLEEGMMVAIQFSPTRIITWLDNEPSI